MTPVDYNAKQLAGGALTAEHVTELVRFWQLAHGLEVDGMAGPKTLASFSAFAPVAPVGAWSIGDDHWLSGPGVTRIPMHASWFGGVLHGGAPGGIVAHYTATDPGTAINMAKRRQHVYGLDPDDRLASWHLTIETDGSIVQMIPFDRVAWHAGSSTAIPVRGLGPANYATVGIELVGYGKEFPPAQVESAKAVWRALIKRYSIAHEYAMLEHAKIDPSRRDDPGPVWMAQHAGEVLAAAYET